MHDPITGWPLFKPQLDPKKITTVLLQDDLTYTGGRVAELENYIQEYGIENMHNIVFLTWHMNLENGAPAELNEQTGQYMPGYSFLKLVYYPTFHYEHWMSAHKENVQKNITVHQVLKVECLETLLIYYSYNLYTTNVNSV